ncbi:helix-turn-helix domain-containing protein [Bacillus sp. JJ722]|uniref:helix-turn-helix domain-containing protein n=1 Tax=Bacillus sp. JJ722 TaxID=3122973 RepID=UPI002FFE0AD9
MYYLAEHQTFNSTGELNSAVYEHIKRNTYDLNETDRLTLKTIARYAVKFAGVAHLKAATLADIIAKSEKTVRRTIAKLADLGIVKKVATLRKVNGGTGANIIVIQPVETHNDQSSLSSREVSDKPTESKSTVTENVTEPSYSINQSKSTLLETATPANALKNSLPNEIYDAMSPYFNAADMYKYYGILLRAKRSINRDIVIEDNAEPFVVAFQNAVMKLKQGVLRSFDNYLFGAWQGATALACRQLYARENEAESHWLFGGDDDE